MNKTICDRCNHYEVSMDGTKEICHAKRIGSQVILWITDDYIKLRMNGDKNNCKAYERIR